MVQMVKMVKMVKMDEMVQTVETVKRVKTVKMAKMVKTIRAVKRVKRVKMVKMTKMHRKVARTLILSKHPSPCQIVAIHRNSNEELWECENRNERRPVAGSLSGWAYVCQPQCCWH